MTDDLLLENPKTGAVKPFRDGFDWILFLFSGALGIPLFLRGLPLWGAVFVALWVVDLAPGLGLAAPLEPRRAMAMSP